MDKLFHLLKFRKSENRRVDVEFIWYAIVVEHTGALAKLLEPFSDEMYPQMEEMTPFSMHTVTVKKPGILGIKTKVHQSPWILVSNHTDFQGLRVMSVFVRGKLVESLSLSLKAHDVRGATMTLSETVEKKETTVDLVGIPETFDNFLAM